MAYYSLEAGLRVLASVTIFEDRAGAEARTGWRPSWSNANLADRFTTPPEITAGPVMAFRVASDSAPV